MLEGMDEEFEVSPEHLDNYLANIDYGTLSRLEQAILLVFYRTHPDALTVNEIAHTIYYEGLVEMSDDEFEKFRQDIINYKRYVSTV